MVARIFQQQWLNVSLALLCLFGVSLGDATHATAAAPVSEGVHVTGADRWQAAGFTGKGIRVGIIQESISSAPQLTGNAKIIAKSFRADGQINLSRGGNNFGTLYAEVIHQMAPDAEIAFAAVDGNSSEDEIVDWLLNTEHVVTYFDDQIDMYALPGGTHEETFRNVKAAGVSVVVPVRFTGSGAIGSEFPGGYYAARFTGADGDGFHDFSPPSGGRGKNALAMRVLGDASSGEMRVTGSPKRGPPPICEPSRIGGGPDAQEPVHRAADCCRPAACHPQAGTRRVAPPWLQWIMSPEVRKKVRR